MSWLEEVKKRCEKAVDYDQANLIDRCCAVTEIVEHDLPKALELLERAIELITFDNRFTPMEYEGARIDWLKEVEG